jgi:hypothetical protein
MLDREDGVRGVQLDGMTGGKASQIERYLLGE